MKKVLLIILLGITGFSAGSHNALAPKPQHTISDAMDDQTAKIDNLLIKLKTIK